jgi:hypothetical protein
MFKVMTWNVEPVPAEHRRWPDIGRRLQGQPESSDQDQRDVAPVVATLQQI